jgi:hypothetical protein
LAAKKSGALTRALELVSWSTLCVRPKLEFDERARK